MKILFTILRTVVAFFICLLFTNVAIYYMLPKMGYALVSTDAEGINEDVLELVPAGK